MSRADTSPTGHARGLLRAGRLKELSDLLATLGPGDAATIARAQIAAAMDWHCDTGHAARAVSLYQTFQAAGADVPFPQRCARLLAEGGQAEAALALVTGWRPRRGVPPAAVVQQALMLREFNDLPAAVAVLEHAAQRHPKAPAVRLHLARLLLALGRFDAATQAFDSLLALQPDQPAWVHTALRVMREGRADLLGLDLALPRDAISPRILLQIVSGTYEQAERKVVLTDLTPQDRVLELGSGIGAMAMWIGALYPDLPVTTVEANPELAPVIRDNFRRNGCRARLIEGVAGDRAGKAAFHLAEDFWASSARPNAQTVRTVTVPMIDVNALIAEGDPTVLIVDIEGGEVELVPSLDLARIRRIAIEMHPDLYSGADYTSVLDHLFRAGFILDRTHETGDVLVFVRPQHARRASAAPPSYR